MTVRDTGVERISQEVIQAIDVERAADQRVQCVEEVIGAFIVRNAIGVLN